MGYFVLLVGSAIASPALIREGTSSTDPKVVVALSLLLGLGGMGTLDAIVGLGRVIRDQIPKGSDKVVVQQQQDAEKDKNDAAALRAPDSAANGVAD